ncbi:M48 family metalloprotease [Streptomyces sp. NPDC054866]
MVAADNSDAACQVRALLENQALRNRWWTGAIAASAVLNGVLVAVVIGAVAHSAVAVFVVLLSFTTCSFALWWRLGSTPNMKVPIEEHERLPAVQELVGRLADRAGIAPPRVSVIEDGCLNAGSRGTPDHSYIQYTSGTLDELPDRELEAITAHEIAHIANGDTRVVAFSTAVMGWVLYLAIACVALIEIGFSVGKTVVDSVDDHETNMVWWPWWLSVRITLFCFRISLFLLLIVWFGIAYLTHLAFMRQREWLADATAARIIDEPEHLCEALDRLDHSPTRLSQGGRWAQESSIAGAGTTGRWWRDLLETHPDLQRRIARLRKANADVPESNPLTWGVAVPATPCVVAVLALGGLVTATVAQSARPEQSPAAGTLVPDSASERAQPDDADEGVEEEPVTASPDTATPPAPAVVGVVDIGQVADDPRATAVATMFDTYFSGINERDYARALSVYDPASGVDASKPGVVQRFVEAVSTSTDADVVIRSIQTGGSDESSDPEGDDTRTLATLTFRSTQSPGYGPMPNPDETCTLWTVTYQLTHSVGEYRIRGAESEHEAC